MTLAGVCAALAVVRGLVPEAEVGGPERSICFMGERRLHRCQARGQGVGSSVASEGSAGLGLSRFSAAATHVSSPQV